MATDLTIFLENRPGSLAEAGEALGGAGVNIDGLFAYSRGNEAMAHLLVEDPDAAREALTQAGFQVGEALEAVVLDVEDRPGALGEVCRKASDAGVNLTLTYAAAESRIVLAADDPDKLRQAVGG